MHEKYLLYGGQQLHLNYVQCTIHTLITLPQHQHPLSKTPCSLSIVEKLNR
jgi:hypothetical protein